jgi:O-antigen/teichoic acid export membrane protein
MTSAASFRKLLTVSAVLVTARLVGAAATFLTQVVLARWLGAEQLGIVVLATALGGVLATLAGVGFAAITPRFVSEYRVSNQPGLLLGFIRSSRRWLAVNSVVLVGGTIAAVLLVPGLVRPELVLPLVIGAAGAPAIGVMKLTGSLANVWRRHFLSFLPDLLLRSTLLLGVVLVMAETMEHGSIALVLVAHLAIVFAVMAGQAAAFWRAPLVPEGTRPLHTHERDWVQAGFPLVVVILSRATRSRPTSCSSVRCSLTTTSPSSTCAFG